MVLDERLFGAAAERARKLQQIENDFVVKCLDYFLQDSEHGEFFIFIVENPTSCLKDLMQRDGGKSEHLNDFLRLWSQILKACVAIQSC